MPTPEEWRAALSKVKDALASNPKLGPRTGPTARQKMLPI
jgi:hypothetical protein